MHNQGRQKARISRTTRKKGKRTREGTALSDGEKRRRKAGKSCPKRTKKKRKREK